MLALLALSSALVSPTKVGASFVYRPPNAAKPKAVVSFLGGAFVGAAPQLTYVQLLSQLADAGYAVVATPYELQFDYLSLCEDALCAMEPAHTELREEFGELPLIGMGHSCGALLHVLLSSVFRGTGGLADAPRAANVLVSFNNKRASDAIPAFGSVVTPAARALLALEAQPLLQPWKAAAAASRQRLSERAAAGRERAAAAAAGPSTDAATDADAADRAVDAAADFATQLLPTLEQIEPLLRQIDEGATEFSPPPGDVRRAAAGLYGAGRTLVLRFEADGLDESPPLPELLRNSGGEVRLTSLPGTHVTPLTPPLDELPLVPGELTLGQLLVAAPGLPSGQAEYDTAAEAVLGFLDEALGVR